MLLCLSVVLVRGFRHRTFTGWSLYLDAKERKAKEHSPLSEHLACLFFSTYFWILEKYHSCLQPVEALTSLAYWAFKCYNNTRTGVQGTLLGLSPSNFQKRMCSTTSESLRVAVCQQMLLFTTTKSKIRSSLGHDAFINPHISMNFLQLCWGLQNDYCNPTCGHLCGLEVTK